VFGMMHGWIMIVSRILGHFCGYFFSGVSGFRL
jgi:hypothetical protein